MKPKNRSTEQQFLSAAWDTAKQIKKNKHHIRALRDISKSTGAGKATERVGGTVTHGKIERCVSDIIDLERENMALEKKADRQFEIILSLINKIENPDYKKLLKYRYLYFQKWDDIAFYMHYSTQYVYELHREALAEVKTLVDLSRP